MPDLSPIEAHLGEARPRALAALAHYFGDVDQAEDAFQEACLRAIAHWPQQGIPRDPVAWLIFSGRNAGIDQHRRNRTGLQVSWDEVDPSGDMRAAGQASPEDRYLEEMAKSGLRDDVLSLLFLCCDEGLAVQDQLALALKIVVGLPVPQIARAFVVRPKTMEQRITRAKKKAFQLGVRLKPPTPTERAQRLDAVTMMVYLMFNEGYTATGGEVHIRLTLCEEAIRLARLLLSLFPAQPEVMGLLALCLLHHARRHARLSSAGQLISLADQDRTLWHQGLIDQGKVMLEKALRKGRPGPLQIQAAIAAVHCSAATAQATDWKEILQLYGALEALQPTPVVMLNKAVALAKVEGAGLALTYLEPLATALAPYLYYHTTRGALLLETGDTAEAQAAYRQALELNPSEAEIHYIQDQLKKIP